MNKIHDISQTLYNIAEWPGDTPFEQEQVLSMKSGYSCNVSYIKTSLHNGTHADAAYHYSASGMTMDQHDLEPYMGRCQVLHVMHAKGPEIMIEDINEAIVEKRVLFRTKVKSEPETWSSNFKSLHKDLIKYLSSLGVILIGTDTPSFDRASSKNLINHQVLLEEKIYNLENLLLDDIEEASYQLIALPLKISADASPVRAVLVEL